jgi:hypothetical protein
MALSQYQIVNSDGSPGGTQVCEGRSCYPALAAGQTRVAMGSGAAPATPSAPVTTVDASGRLVHPQAILPPDIGGQGGPQPRAQRSPVPTPHRNLQTADAAGNPGGISPGPPATLPPPSVGGLPSTGGVALRPQLPTAPQVAAPQDFGSLSSATMANIPAFKNGMMHPAAGGMPLTPGGQNAAQDSGYDDRKQMTQYDTGASAGPFGVKSPQMDGGPMARRAFNASGRPYGGGGGGGGSLAREMYHRIKGAVEGNISGMGPGGTGAPTTDAAYAQQGRRMDRASERYYEQINNPDPQKARGWAKNNLGKNRGNYPALLTDPMMVATEGMGLDPIAEYGTFDRFERTPMADLAMITGGTSKNGLTRKTQPVKVPKVLRDSIDPVKPEFKRELDYSKYATELRDLYRGLNGQGPPVLNQDALMSDLANAKNKGALRQGIEMQAQYDPGGAMERAQGYFDSIFHATQPEEFATSYSNLANRYFADLGMASKKPKQIDKSVKQVARRFGYG